MYSYDNCHVVARDSSVDIHTHETNRFIRFKSSFGTSSIEKELQNL